MSGRGPVRATRSARDPVDRVRPTVVLGLGVTGRATARALTRRGYPVVLVDDAPGGPAQELAAEIGVGLVGRPGPDELEALLAGAGALVATPGLPENHSGFGLARRHGIPIVGELDLAAAWDDRPCAAVTGTNGKTTVTTLVRLMLEASGVTAVEAGNTEVPLVAAIDDPSVEVFVVEASSFRLAPLERFAPAVGTWLNLADDHQDVHAGLAHYEAAKANLWRRFTTGQIAVANRQDPVVMRHAAALPRVETFGLDAPPTHGRHWHVDATDLRTPDGEAVVAVADLARALPHDIANALAATATAMAVGATIDGAARCLRSFAGLPHRVELVGDAGGVKWYDDSKATAPHATLAALEGFGSVVLIAGGRNKGLDLGVLGRAASRVRAVVTIGDAAGAIEAVFAGLRPTHRAGSMDEAVATAAGLARPGDAIVLSPACASFDWYRSYGERGDDFVRAVREQIRPAGRPR